MINLNILSTHNVHKFNNNFIRHIFKKIFKNMSDGPTTLITSILNTLSNLNYKYDYNNFSKSYDIIWIVSGKENLEYALKNKHKFNKIIVGPNLFNLPSDNKIYRDEAIDLFIVPCAWVKEAYSDFIPHGKIYVWPTGINHNYWKPSKKKLIRKVLIYNKINNNDFLDPTILLLKKFGLDFQVITYKKYSIKKFKDILDHSSLCVFYTISESQGLAMFESWSMNVPTLVWNSGVKNINNHYYKSITSAPYLNKNNGLFFNNLEELGMLLTHYKNKNLNNLEPRKWLLNNMSDTIQMKKLIKKIESI